MNFSALLDKLHFRLAGALLLFSLLYLAIADTWLSIYFSNEYYGSFRAWQLLTAAIFALGGMLVAYFIGRKAHRQIDRSNRNYRQLFNHYPVPMWIYRISDLAICEVNSAAIEDYGYSRVEWLSLNLKDIRPPEDVAAFVENATKTYDNRQQGIWRHRRKNGEIFWVKIISQALVFNGENCRAVLAVNVSAEEAEKRLRTEKFNQLKRREQYLNSLLNEQPHYIVSLDKLLRVTYCNLQFQLDFNVARADLGKRLFYTLVAADDHSKIPDYKSLCEARGDDYVDMLLRMHPPGRSADIRWIGWKFREVTRTDGTLELQGCGTMQPRPEHVSQGSTEMALTSLLNQLPDGILILNRDLTIVRSNPAIQEWLGISDAQLKGQHIFELLPELKKTPLPVLAQNVDEYHRKALKQELTVNNRIINVLLYPLQNSYMVVLSDITEQALREREQRKALLHIEEILETIQDPFVMFDSRWKVTALNDAARKALAWRNPALPYSLSELIETSEHSSLYRALTRSRAFQEALTLETHEVLPHERMALVSFYPSETGGNMHVKDIQMQFAARDQIRLLMEKYQIIYRASREAVYDYDLASNTIEWSAGVAHLLGYSTQEIESDVTWWEERLHEEDRARVLGTLEMSSNFPDKIWQETYRFRCADGLYLAIQDTGYYLKNASGRPIRMVGIMRPVEQN